jgi:hypothetical protein
MEKKLNVFGSKKLQFIYPLAYIKQDVQVTEEAFSSQKREHPALQHEIS